MGKEDEMLTMNQAIQQATGRANLTGRKVADRRIMSQSSYSKKKRNPRLFTLDELRKINELVHFTDEEKLAFFK